MCNSVRDHLDGRWVKFHPLHWVLCDPTSKILSGWNKRGPDYTARDLEWGWFFMHATHSHDPPTHVPPVGWAIFSLFTFIARMGSLYLIKTLCMFYVIQVYGSNDTSILLSFNMNYLIIGLQNRCLEQYAPNGHLECPWFNGYDCQINLKFRLYVIN